MALMLLLVGVAKPLSVVDIAYLLRISSESADQLVTQLVRAGFAKAANCEQLAYEISFEGFKPILEFIKKLDEIHSFTTAVPVYPPDESCQQSPT